VELDRVAWAAGDEVNGSQAALRAKKKLGGEASQPVHRALCVAEWYSPQKGRALFYVKRVVF
jgi:hypothetical protein